jgi:hypothetical protein
MPGACAPVRAWMITALCCAQHCVRVLTLCALLSLLLLLLLLLQVGNIVSNIAWMPVETIAEWRKLVQGPAAPPQ